MPRTVRPPGGVSTKERYRLVGMAALLVIAVVLVIQGVALLTGGGIASRDVLTDPDATTALPAYDREPLRDDDAAEKYLLGLVAPEGPLANAPDRGYDWPRASELCEAAEERRGDFVKVIGRIVETVEGRSVLEDAEDARWHILSRESPVAVGDVVKVSGLFLRVVFEPVKTLASGPPVAIAPVVVAIRTKPSVMPQRFTSFEPGWIELVNDHTEEGRLNLDSLPVWYSLAWARTVGPEAELGPEPFDPMPTFEQIEKRYRRLRGKVYRLEGRVDGIESDHDVPENPAGLESVYRIRVRYDRGGRQQWLGVVVAPRGALPSSLTEGDRITADGVFLRVWSTSDESGRLRDVPVLVAPRVRLQDGAGEENR